MSRFRGTHSSRVKLSMVWGDALWARKQLLEDKVNAITCMILEECRYLIIQHLVVPLHYTFRLGLQSSCPGLMDSKQGAYFPKHVRLKCLALIRGELSRHAKSCLNSFISWPKVMT